MQRAATCGSSSRNSPDLGDKEIHEPWKAPELAAGYPEPVVGLPESRERALETYQRLKDS